MCLLQGSASKQGIQPLNLLIILMTTCHFAGETQTMAAATEEQAQAAAQAAAQEAAEDGAPDGPQDMDTDGPPPVEDESPTITPEQSTSLPSNKDNPHAQGKKKGGQGPGGQIEMKAAHQDDDDDEIEEDALENGEMDDRQGDEGSFAAQLQRVSLRDREPFREAFDPVEDGMNAREVSEERLEMLRRQVAEALHGNGEQETGGLPGAQSAEYGQQMWSRCEALTSGWGQV